MRLLLTTLSFVLPAAVAFAGSGSGAAPAGPIAVPEPASLAVLGAGVGAVMLYRRLRK